MIKMSEKSCKTCRWYNEKYEVWHHCTRDRSDKKVCSLGKSELWEPRACGFCKHCFKIEGIEEEKYNCNCTTWDTYDYTIESLEKKVMKCEYFANRVEEKTCETCRWNSEVNGKRFSCSYVNGYGIGKPRVWVDATMEFMRQYVYVNEETRGNIIKKGGRCFGYKKRVRDQGKGDYPECIRTCTFNNKCLGHGCEKYKTFSEKIKQYFKEAEQHILIFYDDKYECEYEVLDNGNIGVKSLKCKSIKLPELPELGLFKFNDLENALLRIKQKGGFKDKQEPSVYYTRWIDSINKERENKKEVKERVYCKKCHDLQVLEVKKNKEYVVYCLRKGILYHKDIKRKEFIKEIENFTIECSDYDKFEEYRKYWVKSSFAYGKINIDFIIEELNKFKLNKQKEVKEMDVKQEIEKVKKKIEEVRKERRELLGKCSVRDRDILSESKGINPDFFSFILEKELSRIKKRKEKNKRKKYLWNIFWSNRLIDTGGYQYYKEKMLKYSREKWDMILEGLSLINQYRCEYLIDSNKKELCRLTDCYKALSDTEGKCSNCGKPIPKDPEIRFCQFCGTEVRTK